MKANEFTSSKSCTGSGSKMPRQRFACAFSRWFYLGIASIICLIFLQQAAFLTFKVPSSSMAPTIEPGDYILVNRLCYDSLLANLGLIDRTSSPERGDVVVYYGACNTISMDRYCVKRVVGLPGEEIRAEWGQVYIDNSPLNTHYGRVSGDFPPRQLGDGEYFMLGDNSSNSHDSREVGSIHRDQILGCATMVYWSWEEDRKFDGQLNYNMRWDRIGKSLVDDRIPKVGNNIQK